MEQNKNTMWMWVAAGVVVLGIVFLVFKNKSTEVVETPVNTNDQGQVANEPEGVQDTTGQVAPISISYANALIKYADRRIQLDPSCQAKPNTVTYKDNSGIMIDNRSAQTRTVKIGTAFTMKPYSFKIVVLPDVYLKSKTILVDCDKSQNVATILVQE